MAEKEQKKKQEQRTKATNKIVTNTVNINSVIATIILNSNGLTIPIKRQR